ncbi:Nucleoid-associated protein YgaU, contains BON and LysM domains [Jannaschia faecimaris]|uniref:Nucleoid-associated protein YgaU, contains BON and LysM domains n=1 Tax=Jannaschia faecimaris TaxID=1244108 RepID=A0A1H3T8T9_9RHOB|nr:LysM peptidoglycan-binding domain-containing protein [Jannaschia faecimaris]SDZ46743.1 Nucleoid-associated protein YgaU, contains BON and LysM domains [Jannaschia faecimaris]
MLNGSGAGRTITLVGGLALLGLAGFLLLQQRDARLVPVVVPADEREQTAEATETTSIGSDVTNPAAQVTDVTPPQTVEVPTAPVMGRPNLDVVRIDEVGSAVVAGRGSGGAYVILRLDGEEVATARIDESGNFVSLFDLGTVDTPRILTVETRDADGNISRSDESIIVAPTFPLAPTVARAPEVSDGSQSQEPADETATARLPPESAQAPPTSTEAEPTAAPVVANSGATSTTAAPPRLFRSGPDGVSVIARAAPTPETTQDIGIDAISYDETGAVSLAGTGNRDSELRIYLDNKPIQLARVGQGGTWSSPLPNVDSGLYTLRIDALAPDGTVQSRIETPFQRTAPEVAAASRRDGVTAITVQPGYTLWAISEGYFGEGIQYVQIFEENRRQIRDPDLIFPGQVFDLPQVE